MLDREFAYFREHQQELVAKYPDRFLVIKDEQVVGDYSSEMEAYREAQKQHTLGTFLIQRAALGTAVYTQAFHSRVRFA